MEAEGENSNSGGGVGVIPCTPLSHKYGKEQSRLLSQPSYVQNVSLHSWQGEKASSSGIETELVMRRADK